MSLSRQLALLVCVSVLLGLGARVMQKKTVPFWGSPEPIELVLPTNSIAGPNAVSPDSAFVPSDKPYKVDLSTAVGLFMKRKKTDVQIVDARDTKLYAEGHIPGAINIPFEHLPEKIALPKEHLILIYCDGGDCHLSHDLAEHLLANGWKRVAVYEGGWAEWSKETDFVTVGSAPDEAQ